MSNEHNNAATTDWRELCRRLYVELWHCDKQMTGGPRPRWTRGSTVRDVLRDASLALEATPASAPAAPVQEPAVPQGWRITEEQDGMISVTSPDGVKWWAVRGGSREEREGKIGAHFYDLCKSILAATPAAPSQPAVPQGIPAHEVIDAIEAWKSAWAKVPPFVNKVNKATREAITFSHNTLFQLLWSAQQAQRMPKACPTPTGCGPHGCRGACITATPAAPSQEPAVPQGWTDADSDAARLALELECLLMDTKDLSVVSKWWGSANDALELHRQRLAATPAPAPAQEVGLTDEVPAHVAGLLEHRRELDAIEFFESTNRDSHKFKKSVRGTYVNPAVARDWKWFQLGMKHATEDES